GNGEPPRAAQTVGLRVRVVVPDRVEVRHAALQCRRVEDRLAVRRKTRRVDGPGTERYGAELHLDRLRPRQPPTDRGWNHLIQDDPFQRYRQVSVFSPEKLPSSVRMTFVKPSCGTCCTMPSLVIMLYTTGRLIAAHEIRRVSSRMPNGIITHRSWSTVC